MLLTQDVSYDNNTLSYIRHVLYKLEKIKIVFEQHQLIDVKLYQPTFNYSKFYTISHFVQCIQNYITAVNYDTAYNKAVHKYLLKAFYNRINKKDYDLLIRQHNVHYTNVITMKNIITVAEKGREI